MEALCRGVRRQFNLPINNMLLLTCIDAPFYLNEHPEALEDNERLGLERCGAGLCGRRLVARHFR
jgi:hypothetical protein